MSWPSADSLSRTIKLEVDDGRAPTFAAAEAIARSYKLQIVVGSDVESSLTRQAMLLTAVNTGVRACPGGVRVLADSNPTLRVPWARGQKLDAAVRSLGGSIASSLDPSAPTMTIGHPALTPVVSTVLIPTWNGWSAGVVQRDDDRLAEAREFPLAGVLAAGMAVSELFNGLRGLPEFGDRSVGLSLWLPGDDWRDNDAVGPSSQYLPARLWLPGLGHLGQAYIWALGMLPYESPKEALFVLQDFDVVRPSNESTSVLSTAAAIGTRKTRVASEAIERLGFGSLIVERRFDEHTRPNDDEPRWALAGFDRPEPRRHLDNFDVAVDCGLGSGPIEYLDMLVHRFPGEQSAAQAFTTTITNHSNVADRALRQSAYDSLQAEIMGTGRTEGEARCGAVEIAGRTVGAAFVGAVASTLVVSEALRLLEGGPSYDIVSLSLREPQFVEVVRGEGTGALSNPGFVRAAAG